MEDIMNKIIIEWIVFKETNKDLSVWAEKRGNKFVMGSVEEGIMKVIDLEEK